MVVKPAVRAHSCLNPAHGFMIAPKSGGHTPPDESNDIARGAYFFQFSHNTLTKTPTMRHIITALSTLFFVCFSVLIFTGCSNPDSRFAKVEGTVTYKGEAVAGASVTFAPASGTGEPASGLTDASGKYTLTTGGAQNAGSGAVPGEYTVLISKVQTTQVTDPDELLEQKGEISYDVLQQRLSAKGGSKTTISHKPLLPTKYDNPGSSPLKATVVKGKTDPINFDLTD